MRAGSPRAQAPRNRKGAGRHRATATRWQRAAPWVYGGIGVLVVFVAFGAWSGSRVYAAYQEIRAAQTEAKGLASTASNFDLDGLGVAFESIADHIDRAREITEEPIWTVTSWIPWAGRNLTIAGELVAVADDTIDLARPLVEWADGLVPSDLMGEGGVLDVGTITEALDRARSLGEGLPALAARAEAIDAGGTISQIRSGADLVAQGLATAASALSDVDLLAEVAPRLLGAEGPETYALVFMNSAEPTPLGGTALSFVELSIDQGRISMGPTLSARPDVFPPLNEPPPIPDGFAESSGFNGYLPGVTSRPDFAFAAEWISQNFYEKFGERPDNVIGLTVPVFRSIVDATGAVQLQNGIAIDAQNVIPFLMNQVYRLYGGDEQDAIYAETASLIFGRITSGVFDPVKLVRGLYGDLRRGNLLAWSADPEIGALFSSVGATRGLPVSDEETERLGLYFAVNVGTKMGYYLQSEVDVVSAYCAQEGYQQHRVTLTMRNALTPEEFQTVGRYVLGEHNPEGAMTLVSVFYLPPGATVVSATRNGEPVSSPELHDAEYPVARYLVAPDPGQTMTLVLDYRTPSSHERPLKVELTPTINGTVLSQSVVDCAAVAAG